MQAGELAQAAARTVAIDQRRQMLAFQLRHRGIHDDDALDQVAQLANIARPGVAHQRVEGVVGNLLRAAIVGLRKLLQEMRPAAGMSSLRSRNGGT